ncbi:MAG: glycoside hydrolase family 28 protein [Selenomonas montiformis]|nr:glycoside hydrolase family 28 protein [Selenomonas montiformis]
MEIISVRDYGAVGDGKTLDTKAFQRAVDQAVTMGTAKIIVPSGLYLLGSVFLDSNMVLEIQEGAVLLGSENISDYPIINTRIAGIEMPWPAALLNVIDAENVHIIGKGVIDGRGEKWWNEYWGADGKGGRRAEYDAKNLRWIADYEIQRPRLLLVQNSRHIKLSDFTARRSGFWTVQLTYDEDVTVSGLCIKDNAGPSTDGIDVDSCRNVHILRCDVACNDDDIVIKSGRDADGLRVNRPCEDVFIEHCTIRSGAGITIGSEVSGGISRIHIADCIFEGTDCGFRMKSSRLRGGYIRDIRVENLVMRDVQFPFSWILDWHPAYNRFILPEDDADIPAYWRRVAAEVPESQQFTRVEHIEISHVRAASREGYEKPSRALDLRGAEQKPMQNIRFYDVRIDTAEFGAISAVQDLRFENVVISAAHGNTSENDTYDQR